MSATSSLRPDRGVPGGGAANERQRGALDEIDEILKDYNDRLTLDRLDLAKRYVEGRLNLCFKFRVSGNSEEYRAFVERIPDRSAWHTDGAPNINGTPIARMNVIAAKGHTRAKMLGPNFYKTSMFVDDIKLVYGPQNVTPSWVRLEPPDHVNGIRVNLCYFSFDLGFECFDIFAKGEIDLPHARRAIRLCQTTYQLIECGSQIMNGIGSNQVDPIWHRQAQANLDMFIDSVRAILVEDAMGFGLRKGADGPVQITGMYFGPFDF